MKTGSVLVFFTDTFPCGKGETFIENEFPYLAAGFSKVFIVTNNITGQITRPVPANTKVVRYLYQTSSSRKIATLFKWFSGPMQQERHFLRGSLGITAQRLSVMLGTFAKMLETEAFLNRLIEEEKLDKDKLYLYSYWFNNMATSLAYYSSKNPGTKAFCRAHRWDIYAEQQPAGYLPFRQFAVMNLSACYPISEDGMAYIKEQTKHVADSKIQLARLGTIGPGSLPVPGNTDKINLVSCSNVIPRKRIDLLIRALEKIEGIPVQWTHFGAGPQLKEIQELTNSRLAQKSNIQFDFRGQVSNNEVLQQYQKNVFDLFVNVSESEGVPVSIMEALSFGIPALATDTGGSREVVVQNTSGYLLPVEVTADEIAATINRFWKLSADEKKQLRNSAYGFWNKHFNAANNYPQFLQGLESLK